MKDQTSSLLIISADAGLTRQLLRAVTRNGNGTSVPVAANLRQARTHLRKAKPDVIFMDEAAIGDRPIGRAVREFARAARVVCLMHRDRQAEVSELGDLILQERVVVVRRQGRFLPRLAAMLDGNLKEESEASPTRTPDPAVAPEGFGEILRHEVNNPLTGILGNAELLLARRDSLPPAAVHRLETIAELAIRLRETIRRLSNTWDLNDHVRSA